MSGGVLVLVEPGDGGADRLSAEALVFARGVASSVGGPVEATVVGPGAAAVGSSLGEHGVTTAHIVEDARLEGYAPTAWAAVLAQLVDARSPVAVVGPGSDRGLEVMAHLGARTGLPVAANVTAVDAGAGGDEPWSLTRLRWAGSLLEDARLVAPVKLLTVAPHVIEPQPVAGRAAATMVPFMPSLTEADLRVRVTGREPPAAGSVSLADARVVVGGGRGVGSAEGFAMLDELASLLGGAVGVSRAVTSAGWRPHTEQVGQTGQRIAPELYIACGISGAIQHIVGCKAAKRILAINTDPEAPIMSRADYAILGDLGTVVPAITAEIRRARAG
jgi:electron transfer flavoprotein alpha subunit